MKTSQFFLAQVVSCFEYLGSQLGVVYRDLKPENLMIDSFGYLRLVDFGFAKQVFSGQTFTVRTRRHAVSAHHSCAASAHRSCAVPP